MRYAMLIFVETDKPPAELLLDTISWLIHDDKTKIKGSRVFTDDGKEVASFPKEGDK